mgnify:CR=1 FL=1
MTTTTNWRLADPEYTEFDPVTVQEAILKFRRMQAQGLPPWKFPEAMIECCKKMPDAEVGKFEDLALQNAQFPLQKCFWTPQIKKKHLRRAILMLYLIYKNKALRSKFPKFSACGGLPTTLIQCHRKHAVMMPTVDGPWQ